MVNYKQVVVVVWLTDNNGACTYNNSNYLLLLGRYSFRFFAHFFLVFYDSVIL